MSYEPSPPDVKDEPSMAGAAGAEQLTDRVFALSSRYRFNALRRTTESRDRFRGSNPPERFRCAFTGGGAQRRQARRGDSLPVPPALFIGHVELQFFSERRKLGPQHCSGLGQNERPTLARHRAAKSKHVRNGVKIRVVRDRIPEANADRFEDFPRPIVTRG